MRMLRKIAVALALLLPGAGITGCIYFPHDRGLHRGAYERDRGRDMQQGHERGAHERGRDHRGDRQGDHRD